MNRAKSLLVAPVPHPHRHGRGGGHPDHTTVRTSKVEGKPLTRGAYLVPITCVDVSWVAAVHAQHGKRHDAAMTVSFLVRALLPKRAAAIVRNGLG